MNADFLLGLSRFKIHLLTGPSDLADRFSYQLSCAVLAIMCSLITLRQYYSTMIQCIFPSPYQVQGLSEYAEHLCWAENTFFIPGQVQSGQPMSCSGRTFEGARVINYYKWVPFMLVLQCMLCYMPHLIWRIFHPNSGLNIKSLVNNAVNATNCQDQEAADKNLALVARSLGDSLYIQREYRKNCLCRFRQLCGLGLCCCGGKRVGNFLTSLYLFVKTAYILNAGGQLLMMSNFLDLPLHYGVKLLSDIHEGNSWNSTGVFPRVTICRFAAQFGNLEYINVCAQCVIPINFLLEAMYILLWFWFAFVLVVSVYSLCTWVIGCLPTRRRHFIKKYFKLVQMNGDISKSRRNHFIGSHLRADGVLALRLIAENTGELCVSELVRLIWLRYLERLRNVNIEASSRGAQKSDYNEQDSGTLLRGGSGMSKSVGLDEHDGYSSDVASSGLGNEKGAGLETPYRPCLTSPPGYTGAAAASAPPRFHDEINDSGHRSSCSSGQSTDFRQASPGSILSRSRRPEKSTVSKV